MTDEVLPWALDGVALGARVVEVGPGPGISTDYLRVRVDRVTAVEIDPALAAALRLRLAGSNVTVANIDAADLPACVDGERFDAAACFTMLHHLPSRARQDQLFATLAHVLEPGGVLVGSDSLPSLKFRLAHLGDTMTPVDPEGLPSRLTAAGFEDIRVDRGCGAFRFRARRS
jgi:SAM-dependent methyltransferase